MTPARSSDVARRAERVLVSSTAVLMLATAGSACAKDDFRRDAGYTVEFQVHNQWRNQTGQVAEDLDVGVTVSVLEGWVFIQSRLLRGEGDIVCFSWGNIPGRLNEWAFEQSISSAASSVSTLLLDSHPTRASPDFYSNLGRLLYVPTNHPSLGGASRNAILYLQGENGEYTADELHYEILPHGLPHVPLGGGVTALSPPYYYSPTGIKRSFGGPRKTRPLWRLEITGYTNWWGLYLPATFAYTRYQDAQRRPGGEPDVPIVTCRGEIKHITAGVTHPRDSRHASALRILDYRPGEELLGRPAVYQSEYLKWPVVGTAEYQDLIATNKARALLSRSIPQAPPREERRRLVLAMMICIVAGPAVAVLLWLRGSATCDRSIPTTTSRKDEIL